MTCMIQHTKTEQNFVFKCKTCKAKQITVISFYDLGVNLSVNWLENRDMILHEYRKVVLKFVQAYIFMDWDVVWFWYRHNYVKNLFEEYWPFSAILTFNDGNYRLRHTGANMHAHVLRKLAFYCRSDMIREMFKAKS